jgi:hypothetical protein
MFDRDSKELLIGPSAILFLPLHSHSCNQELPAGSRINPQRRHQA